ncbi:MAG: hypothetical protein AABX11_05325 [Nanoarchaeota archaeon]
MRKINFEEKVVGLSFLFIFIYILFFLIIPFFRENSLYSWDFPGLKASIEYQKDILPKLSDWNPTFFFGFSQNQFYPPLFSYLGAILSFIFSTEISLKILFSLSLIALPCSFYYFLRKYNLPKVPASVLMIVMFSLLFFIGGYSYGGNMDSTFRVGLITHVLGMVFFFFYAGRLNKDYQEGKFLISSVLFSLAILTHIIAAFACVIYFISTLIANFENLNKTGRYFLKQVGIVFLLTSAWIIPFIFKINFLKSYQIGAIDSKLIMLFVLVWLAISLFKERKEFLNIGIFFVGIFLFNFIYLYLFEIPVHMYRFYMYIILLIPLMAYSLINRRYINVVLVLMLVASIFIIVTNPIDSEGGKIKLEFGNVSFDTYDRVLVLPKINEVGGMHYLQNELPFMYGFEGVRGLYVESSRNARTVYNLESVLNNKQKYSMGAILDSELIDVNNFTNEKIEYELNILGINKVIGDAQFEYGLQSEEIFTLNNESYYVYEFNQSNLIEIWDKNISLINDSANKDEEIGKWFLGDNVSDEILIMKEFPEYDLKGTEKVVLDSVSGDKKEIRFRIESEKEIPVIIKQSYFPNWKAYSDGKAIKIYEVSPSFMMVFAKGEIELRYENRFVDILGLILSLVGVLSLIPSYIYEKKFISL